MRFIKNTETAGSYHINQFCITLPVASRIFFDRSFQLPDITNKSKKTKFSTFIHEYFHYLHNISTVSGILTYIHFQQLLCEFWYFLDYNTAECSGNAIKNPSAKENTLKIIDAYCAFVGDNELESDKVDLNDIKGIAVTEISSQRSDFELYGSLITKETPIIHLSIVDNDDREDTLEFRLGDTAIDESIAYEIDRLVDSEIDQTSSALIVTDNSPPFPYFILRLVSKYIASDSIPIISQLACARIATMCTEPGKALIGILREYSKQKTIGGKTEAEIIDVIWQNVKASVEENIQALLNMDIPAIINQHKGRGIAEQGIIDLTTKMKRYLEMRIANPFFDLVPFCLNNCDYSKLVLLLNTSLPCALIQENYGDESMYMRDELLSFDPSGSSEDSKISDSLRPLQIQIHYLLSHLGETGFVNSSSLQDKKCPFFSCCPLEMRKSNPATCQTNPWKTYTAPGLTCWYGAAVAAVIGNSNVTQIPPS